MHLHFKRSLLDLHLYKRLTGEIEKCVAFCSISTTPFHSSVPRARVRAAGSKVKIRAESRIQSCQSERGLSLYCSLAVSRAEGHWSLSTRINSVKPLKCVAADLKWFKSLKWGRAASCSRSTRQGHPAGWYREKSAIIWPVLIHPAAAEMQQQICAGI